MFAVLKNMLNVIRKMSTTGLSRWLTGGDRKPVCVSKQRSSRWLTDGGTKPVCVGRLKFMREEMG